MWFAVHVTVPSGGLRTVTELASEGSDRSEGSERSGGSDRSEGSERSGGSDRSEAMTIFIRACLLTFFY